MQKVKSSIKDTGTSRADDSPINAALRMFEAAEANLEKLERIFEELRQLVPVGISFGRDPKYDELCRAYEDVLTALPTIDGWKPKETPIDLNVLAQWRLDAQDINEISAIIRTDEAVDAPARELAEYRYRFDKKRRHLVREALSDVMARVDDILGSLGEKYYDNADVTQKVRDDEFDELGQRVKEIEILLGSSVPRPERWGYLRRHINFGQVNDLLDILNVDWPTVKAALSAGLYDQNEPIPVDVSDLSMLAASQPKGTVATGLKWDSLCAEEFERLIFVLISGARGYENPEWLMKTNAADRGRDLSVTRIAKDQLSGVIRSRMIIQCKHWPTQSVGVSDIGMLREQMKLWEPPRMDVLVIATSGRFSSDAVSMIEKHNNEDRALRIEMWPESHLERLLAERPSLIAEFRLR